jgi:hypothetical protein
MRASQMRSYLRGEWAYRTAHGGRISVLKAHRRWMLHRNGMGEVGIGVNCGSAGPPGGDGLVQRTI